MTHLHLTEEMPTSQSSKAFCATAEQPCFKEALHESASYWASVFPDKIALDDVDGNQYTYKQLNQAIDSMRQSLVASGIRPGDCVVAILPAGLEIAALMYACMQTGILFAPFDITLKKSELADRLNIALPKIVFSSFAHHSATCKNHGFDVVTIGHSIDDADEIDSFLTRGAGCTTPDTSAVSSNPHDSHDSSDAPILLIFTSGTTGKPKGILLSERSITFAQTCLASRLACTPHDIVLVALPVCHLFGINAGLLLATRSGATAVLLKKFSSNRTLDVIEEKRITIFSGVPTMFKRMVRAQEANPRDLSSMRTGTIGGARCTGLSRYKDVLNCDVRVVYGMTESPVIAMTDFGDPYDDALCGVGKPMPGVEIRIVDENGKEQDPGKMGELMCRSDAAMCSYLNNQEATKARINPEGWVHTGDIGYVDDFGYLHIAGRNDEVINRGGFKFFPNEVESAYNDHPDIINCCAMGLSHEELGEQAILFVELKGGSKATADELREYAIDKLDKYKIPNQVVIFKKIPRLTNNKPDKQALKKFFESSESVFHSDDEFQRHLKNQREGPVREPCLLHQC